jgi:hypothetical protein
MLSPCMLSTVYNIDYGLEVIDIEDNTGREYKYNASFF